MSLKRKIISGVISAFAVVSFTTFVSAQDTDKSQQDSTQKQERRERRNGGKRDGMGRGFRNGRGGGKMMRGFRELNLTDAQKEQIRTIMEANKPDKSSFEAIRPLMEAKRNGTITAEQQSQLDAFKAQRKQNAENVRNQVLAVLTTEQRAQLEKSKEQWKEKRQERKQMRQERKNRKNTDDNTDN
jgi:protein CpxP